MVHEPWVRDHDGLETKTLQFLAKHFWLDLGLLETGQTKNKVHSYIVFWYFYSCIELSQKPGNGELKVDGRQDLIQRYPTPPTTDSS